MKNKPYPALLRPSNISNEIGKRVPKSRETIPLRPAVTLSDLSNYVQSKKKIADSLKAAFWNLLFEDEGEVA
jgi:hypothetical protein